jgi:hypothetical protein
MAMPPWSKFTVIRTLDAPFARAVKASSSNELIES